VKELLHTSFALSKHFTKKKKLKKKNKHSTFKKKTKQTTILSDHQQNQPRESMLEDVVQKSLMLTADKHSSFVCRCNRRMPRAG
jgi:hypothetical protein